MLLRLAEERNANSIGDRGFGGCQVIEEALLLMAQSPRRKVVPLRDDSAMDGPVPALFAI